MHKIKHVISCLLAMIMIFVMAGCGNTSDQTGSSYDGASETVSITIAYQEGLAYAPVIIAMEEGLIEEYYYEATGNTVEITWNIMNSGADINTSFTSGDLDIGFLGVAPVVTGIVNNVGYKVFTGISGQEYELVTNNSELTSLEDFIGTDFQISVNSLNSIAHIILAKALVNAGYDAHELDSNLIGMGHSDAMSSLQSGNLTGHMSTNPYVYKESENEDLYIVDGISEVWSAENSLVVGVASVELYEENNELYNAVCDAIQEATDLINSDVEAAAAITYEYNGNTLEDEISYIEAGNYTTETSGMYDLAEFMAEAEFIDEAPESYDSMTFDNVVGD